jgi:glycosyltransferase involved in cell wall biosynthesis
MGVMDDDILVSVVLCTYNGAKFLEEQLTSIINQTHKKLEIIISDDASTDNTIQVINEYAFRDHRIIVFQNTSTIGIKKNFGKVLRLAKGEWIAISDQDDIWVENKIEKLLKCRTAHSLLIHSYNAEFLGTNVSNSIVNRKRKRFSGSNTRQLFFYNTIYGHTVLLNNKLLQLALPFPPVTYYDWWLGIIASIHGTVEVNKESLVLHREHESNFSRVTITDTKASKEYYFKELAAMVNEFLSIEELNTKDKQLLVEYRSLIEKEWKKSFSLPVFNFFLKHASTAFYFRDKRPKFFYHLKYSWYRATMEVKHWT